AMPTWPTTFPKGRSMPDDWREGVRHTGGHDPYAIPLNLPYVALGYRGDFLFFLNGLRAFLALRVGELSRESVPLAIFASSDNPGVIYDLYLVMVMDKKTLEWKQKPDAYKRAKATAHMLRLAYEAGQFNPEKQLRGRGAWLDDDRKGPRLAINRRVGIGKGMHLGRQATRLGFYNGHAYIAGGPALELGRRPAHPDRGPAWLDETLAGWTFAYPTLGPRLLTGWLALAPLSGALAPK